MQKFGIFSMVVILSFLAFLTSVKIDVERKSRDASESLKSKKIQLSSAPEKFAFIINGSKDKYHHNNLVLAYESLRSLGLSQNHIFVLDEQAPLIGNKIADSRTSINSFVQITNIIKKVTKKSDILLVYVTGHGGLMKNYDSSQEAAIVTEEGGITIDFFVSSFKKIAAQKIFLFDCCYCGNFAKEMNRIGGKYISIANQDENREAVSVHFAQIFFSSFLANARLADIDHNNRVDISEAFQFATRNDPFVKNGLNNPVMYGNIDAKNFFID